MLRAGAHGAPTRSTQDLRQPRARGKTNGKLTVSSSRYAAERRTVPAQETRAGAEMKSKYADVFSERECFAEASAQQHAGNDADARQWVAVARRLHCNECNVLIGIPMDRATRVYMFEWATATHEISCPLE